MFTKEDEALHKGLMKLLNEATFPLKAREAHAFLAIYDWAQKLPERGTKAPKKSKGKH